MADPLDNASPAGPSPAGPAHRNPSSPGPIAAALGPLRRLVRTGLLTAKTYAAVVGIKVARAVPAVAVPAADPVGSWAGTVIRDGAQDANELSFSRDGRACLRTAGSTGSGTWKATGPGCFTYRITEDLGATIGTVRINQSAVQVDGRFVSSGISRIYDADGGFLGTARATVIARRTSTTPFTC